MAKFTKTQAKLLKQVAEKGRISVGSYSGQGPEGGRVSGGGRETDAALALEKMGLLVRKNIYSTTRYQRGYGIHITDILFVAPEASNG